MGFSRQEYWSGVPFPSPGYLSDAEIEPAAPAVSFFAGRFFTPEPPEYSLKPHSYFCHANYPFVNFIR